MKNLTGFFSLALIILLSYFVVKPFFISGFFPMHDDTQVARVYEMGKALEDGMFPVRWVKDLGYGYGYPIFNFYAPLAYYIGGFFMLIGFDALMATELMMGIGILLSGIFMYLLAKEFWGEVGGIISALFYLYAPYHALDIFVRGDVSEFFAYAFIPLVFFALHKVYKEQKWKWVTIGSLGYAGIILSHNLTAMMLTPFMIIIILLYCYIAFRNKTLYAIRYVPFTIGLGLLISAFYWLPALLEMQYTNIMSQIGGGANFLDHFVCLDQLWDSHWGFGGSVSGCLDGMSFKIGKLHIALSLLAFVVLIFFLIKDKIKKHKALVPLLLSIIGFLFSIFFMLDISKIIWETIPFMAFLQYPWRFLILASFFSSFGVGFTVWFIENIIRKQKTSVKISFVYAVVLIFLLIFFNTKLFQPQTYLAKDAKNYTSEQELKWRVSKISDEYMPKDFSKPVSYIEVANDLGFLRDKTIQISQLRVKTQIIEAAVYSFGKKDLNIEIAPFPAWKAYVDDKEAKINRTDKGLELFLPEGKHIIKLIFEQTAIEKIANIISIIGVAMLILGIIRRSLLKK